MGNSWKKFEEQIAGQHQKLWESWDEVDKHDTYNAKFDALVTHWSNPQNSKDLKGLMVYIQDHKDTINKDPNKHVHELLIQYIIEKIKKHMDASTQKQKDAIAIYDQLIKEKTLHIHLNPVETFIENVNKRFDKTKNSKLMAQFAKTPYQTPQSFTELFNKVVREWSDYHSLGSRLPDKELFLEKLSKFAYYHRTDTTVSLKKGAEFVKFYKLFLKAVMNRKERIFIIKMFEAFKNTENQQTNPDADRFIRDMGGSAKYPLLNPIMPDKGKENSFSWTSDYNPATDPLILWWRDTDKSYKYHGRSDDVSPRTDIVLEKYKSVFSYHKAELLHLSRNLNAHAVDENMMYDEGGSEEQSIYSADYNDNLYSAQAVSQLSEPYDYSMYVGNGYNEYNYNKTSDEYLLLYIGVILIVIAICLCLFVLVSITGYFLGLKDKKNNRYTRKGNKYPSMQNHRDELV